MQPSLFAEIDYIFAVLVIFQLTLGDFIPLFHTHLDVYDKPS
jgi:hypothetical protein